MNKYEVKLYKDGTEVYTRELDISEINPSDLAFYVRTALQEIEMKAYDGSLT